MNKINNVEFYITNVCNFSCKGCVSYNNLKFNGHQLWSDYEAEYTEWSKQVDINRIDIVGGEPLLNPSIIDWLYGLRRLWPNTEINIVSNGSQLTKVKNLYTAMKDNNIAIDITMHSHRAMTSTAITRKKIIIKTPEDIRGLVKEFYNADITPEVYEFPTPVIGNDVMRMTNYFDGHVRVRIKDNIEFLQIAGLVIDDTGGFKIEEQSSPAEAFTPCIQLCDFHPFVNGKLYQCKFVALVPELLKQQNQRIPNLEHIESYVPLSLDSTNKTEFIQALDSKHIDQCRFCPKKYQLVK